MSKKIITLEQLYQFCVDGKLKAFKAQNEDATIVVSIPGTYSKKDEDVIDDRFYPISIKACHTLTNLNKSAISEDVMDENKKTIYNCPILASVIEKEDQDGNKSYDFNGHDMELIDNPFEEDEKRVNYIERPVGVVPSEATLTLEDADDDTGRKFLCIDKALIYEEHGNLTADILRIRNEVDCSVEISVEELSYDAKNKVMNILKFKFLGITLLGTHVKPGMSGSKVYSNYSYDKDNDDLVAIKKELKEIKDSLSNFNINENQEKGGNEVSKFEELLEKYGKTADDIQFEYEGFTDEELEVRFAEAFDKSEGSEEEDNSSENSEKFSKTCPECGATVEDDDATECPECGADLTDVEADDEDDTTTEDEACGGGSGSGTKKKKKKSNNSREFNETFELSFNEIGQALNALCSVYRNEDEWCYVQTVYETYFVMYDWDSEKIYKQEYTKDGDNISLSGERVQLFAMYLTESEKIAVEDMRENYSVISEKLASYEKAELDAKKDEIFADESYKEFIEEEEFKTLEAEKDNYSLDELRDKCDLAFAKCVKKAKNFTAEQQEEETKPVPKKHGLFSIDETGEKKPYGNIFAKEKN